jgi:hypothetical protein
MFLLNKYLAINTSSWGYLFVKIPSSGRFNGSLKKVNNFIKFLLKKIEFSLSNIETILNLQDRNGCFDGW